MHKHIFTFFICLLASSCVFGQLTDGFNYQAVARDAGGAILPNTSINIRFQIKTGDPSGNNAYTETHAPTTNEFGLFSLVIGKGNVESGSFGAVDWSGDKQFLIVELNGSKIDTSQFQAVPYSQLATDMELADLTDISGTPAVGQILRWDGTEWGPGDDISDDADADANNELQTISKSGNNVTLSDGGGTFTDEVDDADADPNNEIQTISKSGNTVTLSNGGGTFNDAVNDNDSNPNNEIQTLTLSGNNIVLSNGGGSVAIPSSSVWNTASNDIYFSSGNVGVGVNNPLFPLHIGLGDDVLWGNNATTTGSKLFYDSSKGGLIGGRIGNYNPVDSIDFYSIAWGFEPVARGDYSAAFNSQSRAKGNLSFAAGFRTESSTYIQTTIGRYNVATNGSVNTWVTGDPLFVIGNGTSSANRNNALTLTKGGLFGLNEDNPFYMMDIENDDLSSRTLFIDHNATASNAPTQYGVYIDLDKTNSASATTVYGGYAVTLSTGGTAYGIYGWGNSDASNAGAAYGVRAIADNDNGTGVTYGVYGSFFSSSSSGAKYAGYFAGNVFTTGTYQPSDFQLKNDVRPSGSVMDKLMQLQISNYTYKRDELPHMNLPKGERTGFVAQNVAEVMPELVEKATQPEITEEEVAGGATPGAQVDFQAVDYAGMVPYLVKAIQEQQAEIQALKAEIQALKDK
ncbi:MAG: tail fiber domain-containing protein [Bacteroidota bacterium]